MRRFVALLVVGLMLSSCGLADARDHAIALAKTQPLGGDNSWSPGLVGLSGYEASGLGPVGYPGVVKPEKQSPAQQLLQSVSLRTSDLVKGFTVELIPDGNSLNTSTIDFCNGKYASEANRTARHQVAVFGSDGGFAGVSSEAVLYDTADHAKAALAEIVDRKTACPDGYTFTDSDKVKHTLNFFPAPGPTSTVLLPAHVVLHEVDKTKSDTNASLLVYQVRGKLLVAFYATEPQAKPLSQSSLDGLYGLVSAISKRMNAVNPPQIAA